MGVRSWREQRVRDALAAIADTFVPGDGELPAASELGVPEALLELLATEVSTAERHKLHALLLLWDTPALTAVAGGGFSRFGALSQEDRERVLRSWCDSRLRDRRAAFQAFRRAVLALAYMLPGPSDPSGPNPRWGRIRYPGPAGRISSSTPKAITPLPVVRDLTLECDVCVVGSGAGGGTAAGVLAEAGLDVVVLEAGDYYDDADFDGSELDGYRRLYLGKAALATVDQGVGLLAGANLGGGTTVNFSTSFRTPDDVRQEWAGFGLPELVTQSYDRSLDAVWERLNVNTDHSLPSAREALMKQGLEALGWHAGVMPRNVRGCDQALACGYGGFGCLLGAKQTTTKTWLADAHRHGARILVRTRAEEVTATGGRADGVRALTDDGHAVRVNARAVVVAAGALGTPVLLRRSGLQNANIGRHLRLHPVVGVGGTFDDEIRPWEGTMQAVYSDEHADLRSGYGVKYESAPLHPSVLNIYAPWRSASEHAALLEDLSRVVPIGILLRDSSEGVVDVGRHGHAIVRYALNDVDVGHMRVGLQGGARVLEAAGAKRIFSSHSRVVAYEPGRNGSVERFSDDADRCGWRAGQVVLTSFHIQGSCRMGGSAGGSACNPDGETWDVAGLYVLDGSAFPTAAGVNPMITIEAIAHLNASKLSETLT